MMAWWHDGPHGLNVFRSVSCKCPEDDPERKPINSVGGRRMVLHGSKPGFPLILPGCSGTSHNRPSHEWTTFLYWTLVVAPNEITTELVLPFMQEFNIGRAWKFNIELQRSRGIAIAILGHQCLMGWLLLRSSMRLIGLVDQLSVHIWQDRDHRAGSQRRQSWTDQQIWFPDVSVSVVHWCRSLLPSFSTCYLGILGLVGAINCILAWTSHQRTTSKKRTKALLPKCPLFGGSTVYTW